MTITGRSARTSGAEIAVVGSTTIDRILGTRLHSESRIGGVTTYAGLTYRHLGLSVHIVSNIAIGDSYIGDRLIAAGLHLHFGKSSHTTRFVNRVERDRRQQEMPSAADTIGRASLSAILPQLDWVHLGPLHPLDLSADLLAALSDWNNPVLLDVQGYTRKVMPDTFHVLGEIDDLLPKALTAANMVKANREELEIILRATGAGPRDLMDACAIDELIVTRGPGGGTIWPQKGPAITYSAPSVREVIDPTGAGDVFFAAYAANRLIFHQSIQSASRRAARLAADQVAGKFIRTENDLQSQERTHAKSKNRL